MVDEENKLAPAELGGSCSGKRRALPPRTLLGPQFPWRTVSLFAAVAVYTELCVFIGRTEDEVLKLAASRAAEEREELETTGLVLLTKSWCGLL